MLSTMGAASSANTICDLRLLVNCYGYLSDSPCQCIPPRTDRCKIHQSSNIPRRSYTDLEDTRPHLKSTHLV